MKAYWGNICKAPLILHIGTRWTQVVNFTPRALYTRENQNTHRTGRWVGPTASLDVSGNKENLLPLPEFEPRTVQLAALSL